MHKVTAELRPIGTTGWGYYEDCRLVAVVYAKDRAEAKRELVKLYTKRIEEA